LGHFDYQQFARRHRPHVHPLGTTLFLTFRLAGTVAKETVRFYKARGDWIRREFARITAGIADHNDPLLLEQIDRLESFEREWFLKFEEILHKDKFGPTWLKEDSVAQLVADVFHELDNKAFRLDAYSIMSNHVHSVFMPLLSDEEVLETYDPSGRLVIDGEHPSLAKIMQSIKGKTARICNQHLGRTGQFWEHENFDRVIRSGRFDSTVRYVLNNPVKAGLVNSWKDWKWSYLRKDLDDIF
jgi:REP element-mobilizing transposase RayT